MVVAAVTEAQLDQHIVDDDQLDSRYPTDSVSPKVYRLPQPMLWPFKVSKDLLAIERPSRTGFAAAMYRTPATFRSTYRR